MKYRLSGMAIEAIEKILNKNGKTEAIVKVEDGKVAVLINDRKRIV